MIKVNNQNYYQKNSNINLKPKYPIFRAETNPQENDKVELSTSLKKNDNHKYQKYGLIGAISLFALAGGASLIVKHIHKSIDKLYSEKLVISHLPENIEFKPAKTIEEALNFTKEVLGIKEVSGVKNLEKENTLDALNYVNKSIVDISNVNNGKLYMTPKVEFAKMGSEDDIAGVNISIHSKDFGVLQINTDYFDTKKVNDFIRQNLYNKDGAKKFYLDENKGEYFSNILENKLTPYFTKEVTPLLDKYYSNPESLSFREKMILRSTLFDKQSAVTTMNRYPIEFMNKNKKIFDDVGITVDMDKFLSMTKKEQTKYIKELLHKKVFEKNSLNFMSVKLGIPESNIYHEYGHLQDFGKNLKNTDVKMLETGNFNLIIDRWGTLYDDTCLKAWEADKTKEKTEFKKQFPLLHEFLMSKEKQETAGKISSYAQSGVGEFIAETYALKVEKKLNDGKISDEVENLYKQYNGPELS